MELRETFQKRWPWFQFDEIVLNFIQRFYWETDMTEAIVPWNSLLQTPAAECLICRKTVPIPGNEVVFLFFFRHFFIKTDGLSASFLKTLRVCFFGVVKKKRVARSAGLWATFSESAAVSWVSRWDRWWRKKWNNENLEFIQFGDEDWMNQIGYVWCFWKIYYHQYMMRTRAKFDCWESNINIPNLPVGTDVSEGIQRLPNDIFSVCWMFLKESHVRFWIPKCDSNCPVTVVDGKYLPSSRSKSVELRLNISLDQLVGLTLENLVLFLYPFTYWCRILNTKMEPELWKNLAWLFRVYRGLYYPVI